jgi:hypothetical protein
MTDSPSSRILSVAVPNSMVEGIDGALVRLGSGFPELQFSKVPGAVEVLIDDHLQETLMKKEILAAIYREIIFLKTIEIRSKIIG